MNVLANSMKAWDGKSVKVIQSIYDEHSSCVHFAELLLNMIHDAGLQKGATWLLKRFLESGNQLSSGQINTIYRVLPELKGWEARLHLLQIIPYLEMSRKNAQLLDSYLPKCLDDKNKFIRAWAYQGWFELACRRVEYRERVRVILKNALADEAPSVRARIRNIFKPSAKNIWLDCE